LPKSISDLYPPVYSEAEVPAYRLPQIGEAEATRRLFEEHIYGRLAIEAPEMRIDIFNRDEQALGGLARRRQVRVSLRNSSGQFEFVILLYLPAQITGPAPLFLGLNFMGNHTVHADPSIALPASWSPSMEDVGSWAAESKRGSWASRWPLDTVLQRGYGIATIYCGDFAPDHPEHFEEGVLRLLPERGNDLNPETRGGAIAAWAWGLSRALDALVTLPEIDPSRIAVMGHSRLGKGALWAGACDPRFPLVISNNSGSGGAALFRRRVGERIVHLNGNFPHWFAKAFHRYDEREAELPVDQHQLLALMAPRAVYVASAEDDKWADPYGEYLALVAAASAWNEKMAHDFPAIDAPIHLGQLGYHVRSGPHEILAYDWQQYLDFADRIWK
jgi:hypothetical protein